MLEIAICDDEKLFSDTIKEMISEICSKNQIEYHIAVLHNASEIINYCLKYHVIFMDIDMPEINGIEATEQINKKKDKGDYPLIAFVSNMENLVFKALEQYPYVFLRKSHLKDVLEKSILKIRDKSSTSQRAFYSIKVGRNKIIIDLNNTMYLEKENA